MVAWLEEWSLPTPEIRGSNPNIGKVLNYQLLLNRKDENKEKEAGIGPSLKILVKNYCSREDSLQVSFTAGTHP